MSEDLVLSAFRAVDQADRDREVAEDAVRLASLSHALAERTVYATLRAGGLDDETERRLGAALARLVSAKRPR